jgi:ubiquitin carboxyl-terminal hydrolase 8
MNKPVGLVGLVNLGNTCFLNSCLQVLNHITELYSILECETPKNKESPDSIMLKEWLELRQIMWSGNGSLSPNKFVHMVQQVATIKNREIFTGWAQNDITEFLLFLIECFHNSISHKAKIQINGTPENDVDQRAIICYKLIQSIYAKEYSKILDLFYGIYMTEIIETNNERTDPKGPSILSTKAEHYFVLDLQIFYNNTMCGNLYDCFNLFIMPELMTGENEWFNEQTGQKQTVNRQVNFWNFPEILVITLKRFSPDGVRKLQHLVDFPLEDLDLSKYAKGYQSSKYVYDLFGVCNHSGGVLGGHYTAFVKNAEGVWYHYNDQMIELINNPQSIVSPAAYCLFYRKKIPYCNI